MVARFERRAEVGDALDFVRGRRRRGFFGEGCRGARADSLGPLVGDEDVGGVRAMEGTGVGFGVTGLVLVGGGLVVCRKLAPQGDDADALGGLQGAAAAQKVQVRADFIVGLDRLDHSRGKWPAAQGEVCWKGYGDAT